MRAVQGPGQAEGTLVLPSGWPGFVAIDCETTGLDPQGDELLQLAAVRVGAAGETTPWSTLVNPGRPVPVHILQLTGLTVHELQVAPHPGPALDAFLDFVAGWPLVAHNAAFDAAFLRARLIRHGRPPLQAPVYDTLELARLLDPLAPSHRLEEVVGRYGLSLARAHDALADAQAAAELLLAELRALRELEPALQSTLRYLLGERAGSVGELLRLVGCAAGPPQVIRRRGGSSAAARAAHWSAPRAEGGRAGAAPEDGASPPLSVPPADGPLQGDQHLDAAQLSALLLPGSPLAAVLGTLEARPGQARMLTAVAEAFAKGRHLVVEAGTGTGKSLAYLLPALAWAAATGERVVVATHTLNLQEQLMEKDLPAVAAAGVLPVRAAALKGRSQYACLKLWEEQLATGPAPEDGPFLARFAAWLAATDTGDRSELGVYGEDEERFAALSTEAAACTGRHCPFYDACFLFRARRLAEEAQVVVVNHALLLADLHTGGGVLPPYRYLVCDEAHHLEDQASQHLGRAVGERGLERFFRLLERPAGSRTLGLLTALRSALEALPTVETREGGRPAREALPATARSLQRAAEALARAREGAADCFGALRALVCAGPEGARGERWTVRLPQSRDAARATWEPVWAAGERLGEGLRALGAALEAVADGLEAYGFTTEGAGDAPAEVRAVAERAGELAQDLGMCLDPAAGWVAWVEVLRTRGGAPGAVLLRASPIDPADILQRELFATKRSVVLTSATLSVRGDCRYTRERLGLHQGPQAERTDELIVDSPFAYRQQALLCVPSDVPPPGSERPARFAAAAAPWLLELLTITRGHALMLFTANRLLREIRTALRPGLERAGIGCLAQGIDGSRSALARALRQGQEVVVLGAASFWEGVDVPGAGLRLLIIVQLPFWPPDMPLQQARLEAIAARGGSPFTELQLPQAILRFKQGFGRLIRSAQDRGAAVVLDRRLATASYGSLFIQSLPEMELRVAPRAEILREVVDWLGPLAAAAP